MSDREREDRALDALIVMAMRNGEVSDDTQKRTGNCHLCRAEDHPCDYHDVCTIANHPLPWKAAPEHDGLIIDGRGDRFHNHQGPAILRDALRAEHAKLREAVRLIRYADDIPYDEVWKFLASVRDVVAEVEAEKAGKIGYESILPVLDAGNPHHPDKWYRAGPDGLTGIRHVIDAYADRIGVDDLIHRHNTLVDERDRLKASVFELLKPTEVDRGPG